MFDKIKALIEKLPAEIAQISDKDDLERFRLKYLVKKGAVQELFQLMKDAPKADKPLLGKELNMLKSAYEKEYARLKEEFENRLDETADLDLSLPGRREFKSAYHPALNAMRDMVKVFVEMGFAVAQGPEIEDDFHNFDALNFPKDHPARDLQDTFFMKTGEDLLLRTHTSPVQIRVMKAQKPPIRCIMPGRVYRNEAISARALAEFHQIEGLYIDKNVSLAELKGSMMEFARRMYGANSKFRFRPHFFPFTEPSAEMDISCYLCKGKGCRVCKYTGWLEIVGCGMVHPNVLRNGGIDPDEYSGYAFGFGIERVAMLRTGIDDIRLFYDNDLRVQANL